MEDVVKFTKKLAGATKDPAPGAMRYNLAKRKGIEYDKDRNGIHASGEVDEVKREIANFISDHHTNVSFPPEEAKQAAEISDSIDSCTDCQEHTLER